MRFLWQQALQIVDQMQDVLIPGLQIRCRRLAGLHVGMPVTIHIVVEELRRIDEGRGHADRAGDPLQYLGEHLNVLSQILR